MSIDRVTTANSIIREANLGDGVNGFTDYDLHCTAHHWLWWWVCTTEDMHFIKMDVQLNDNANDVKFKLAENENANPQEFDVRKILGHELFHEMGMDHESSSIESYILCLCIWCVK